MPSDWNASGSGWAVRWHGGSLSGDAAVVADVRAELTRWESAPAGLIEITPTGPYLAPVESDPYAALSALVRVRPDAVPSGIALADLWSDAPAGAVF